MEVLKTSEELERQILEDARKKAGRVIEAADKECAQIRAEWEAKLREETARLEAAHKAAVDALGRELDASIPLDRMRERLTFMEKTLVDSVREVFKSLTQKETRAFFVFLIRRISGIFSGKHVLVRVEGMAEAEVRKLLTDTVPSISIESLEPLTGAGGALLPSDGRGLILETTDRKIHYRGTFNEIARIIMEERRDEFVKSLFGKDIGR